MSRFLFFIDGIINSYENDSNMTVTLSTLLSQIKRVTRNLGGFFMPAVHQLDNKKST
ncbi:hypothetical protein [Marinomonas primoryensis]|uniref:Uncharacterized protein n=1 Tax=Marinomonas primoryensis TaxID=178399 RepID=A0A859D4P1_9GAMM|nr:hypothetical protein [Marinomonas primoryensis]QKK81899.1 uncharacterized protein MP3633_3172 [Marinomonas primoryensis]